jgi:CheY-like chemotaxis protein
MLTATKPVGEKPEIYDCVPARLFHESHIEHPDRAITGVAAEGMGLPAKPLKLILVVDDDEQVRAFLKESLNGSGYIVREAASAGLALKILGEHRIDLIIVDATSFEKDGQKYLRELRRAQPGMKTLAMTAKFPAVSTNPPFVSRPARFPAMEPASLKARLFLGADATLPKPVSAELLIETTRKLLGDGE